MSQGFEPRAEQWLAWANKGRGRSSLLLDQPFVEADPFVFVWHLPAHADLPTPVTDRRRNVGDLETSWFTLVNRPAEHLERLNEVRFDVMRL